MSHVTCPGCGKPAATARAIATYHYTESGLDNVWLVGGVTETECSECGEKFLRVTREPQLLQVIALDLLMRPSYRTGAELRFLRRACGLSQEQLAALLQCPRRATIAEREAKDHPGLSFPEEVGYRWVLLKAFQEFVTTPGNNALEASHLQKFWSFAGFFRDFAIKVDSHHRRITARVRQNAWTVDEHRGKAA
ncbi:MAG TPA: hypothetical protein VGK93_08260 [Candidatus Eisenbacteria bacterium]|jgi:transcriptional regulator with XRE-family HTH domain